MERHNRSKEMMQYVPAYYNESKYYLAHNNAKGKEFDILRTMIDEMIDQFNPQTATWSLYLWEEFCGIPTAPEMSTEERRLKIITMLSNITPMTRRSMQRLIFNLTGYEVKIIKNIAPYTFQVVIPEIVETDYDKLTSLIREVKDAHLDFNYCNEIGSVYNKNDHHVSTQQLLSLKWWGKIRLDGTYLMDGTILLHNTISDTPVSTKYNFTVQNEEKVRFELQSNRNKWSLDGNYGLNGVQILNATEKKEEL